MLFTVRTDNHKKLSRRLVDFNVVPEERPGFVEPQLETKVARHVVRVGLAIPQHFVVCDKIIAIANDLITRHLVFSMEVAPVRLLVDVWERCTISVLLHHCVLKTPITDSANFAPRFVFRWTFCTVSPNGVQQAPFRGVRQLSADPLVCIFCIKVWRLRKCFTSLRYPETLIR